MTHADFRPKKRSGFVPSGKPRRKIPLLRILLLVGLAVFVYLKFDTVWSAVRVLNPVALVERVFGDRTFGEPTVAGNVPRPQWNADSTEFSLVCSKATGGLGDPGACCEAAPAAGRSVCRQAAALVAKAQTRGVIGTGTAGLSYRLHARAGVSPAGRTVYHLVALQTSGSAAHTLRRNSAGVWCDTRRVCLSTPTPQAPLASGRLMHDPDAARWVSASSAVHPVLSGRVLTVDSVTGGARVRLYHGGELYTTYEPLRIAPGVRPGATVTPRSTLGEAPWLAAGYTVFLRVRRAGLTLDPSEFFAVEAHASLDDAALSADSGATVDDEVNP